MTGKNCSSLTKKKTKKNYSMKKICLLIVLLTSVNLLTTAQDRYFTKTGTIDFDGKSTFSKVHAENNSATCVLDTKTGIVQFSMLMKGFEFPKAIMQTHFNERYVESDKFPQSEFKGKIESSNLVNYTTDGVYDATVKGKLTIHGETKDIEATGKIIVKGGKIFLTSVFTIQVPDYKIKADMNDQVTITVNCILDPLTN